MVCLFYMTDQVSGFPPIIQSGFEPVCLVLGTAPSVKSLEKQQYYGHPQNAFWWIMSELFSFDLDDTYQLRKQHLINAKVAVWDVLASCERPGSLDSDIKVKSEIANPIIELLQSYSSIKAIACNGGKSYALLKKHFPQLFDGEGEYEIYQLPSTSPAYAKISRKEKLKRWSIIKSK